MVELYVKIKILELVKKKIFFYPIRSFEGLSDIIPMVESIKKMNDEFKHKNFNFCLSKSIIIKVKNKLRKIFNYIYKGLISLIYK